jgi:hypothetical protein
MNKLRNRWENLYDRLVRREGHEILGPPKEVIDSALERLEELFHTPLPQSYTEFIHLFGPGEIGKYFEILAPSIQGFKDWGLTFEHEKESWPEYLTGFGRSDLAARTICFSTTVGGDSCFWDPNDVRDTLEHEYGIYVHSRDAMTGDANFVAPSFQSFIEDVCLGKGFEIIVKSWELPPQSFSPAWPTRKIAN